MKLILAVFLWCLAGYSFSQENGQNKISDSGKIEFKKQNDAEKPDYSTAYRILKNQLKQNPNNAELHYFFGYTIDRMNAFDGSTMFELKKEKTLEASAHFETVNKLEPVYKGEIVILDPYAKLSSVWGSLAQAYLFRKLKDSAAWAFKEGKKRGAFIEPVLEYNRQLLNSCTKNAILVTSGDNITIPAWYLQEAENYRTDVTIVDASLINTSWYPKYLKNDKNLNISFSDKEIDSIDYIEFKPRYITISNPDNSNEKFTWELRPTYLNNYILKGDRILLNILKENLFSRDIYFSYNSDSTWNLFLENYFMEDGLVNKVLKKGAELTAVIVCLFCVHLHRFIQILQTVYRNMLFGRLTCKVIFPPEILPAFHLLVSRLYVFVYCSVSVQYWCNTSSDKYSVTVWHLLTLQFQPYLICQLCSF